MQVIKCWVEDDGGLGILATDPTCLVVFSEEDFIHMMEVFNARTHRENMGNG